MRPDDMTEKITMPAPDTIPQGVPLAFDPEDLREPEPDDEDMSHAEYRQGEMREEREFDVTRMPEPVNKLLDSDTVAALRIAKDLLAPKPGMFGTPAPFPVKPMDLIMLADYILHPDSAFKLPESPPEPLPPYPAEDATPEVQIDPESLKPEYRKVQDNPQA